MATLHRLAERKAWIIFYVQCWTKTKVWFTKCGKVICALMPKPIALYSFSIEPQCLLPSFVNISFIFAHIIMEMWPSPFSLKIQWDKAPRHFILPTAMFRSDILSSWCLCNMSFAVQTQLNYFKSTISPIPSPIFQSTHAFGVMQENSSTYK